ncbi:MAG: STAS domain-containing protein [Spirochaetes bacterium]|nr:STAS domain-containing protein [Spirochaetota bacterium]
MIANTIDRSGGAGMIMVFDIIKISQISAEKIDYATLVFKAELPKKIDIDNSKDLWIFLKTLVSGGALKLYVDFTKVEYIDSSGIGVLINTAKLIRARKGDIIVANPSDEIREIFKVINLGNFIKIYNSEVEALKSFRYVE